MTWVIRVTGLVGLFAGFKFITLTFSTLGAFIPVLGSLLDIGGTLMALVSTIVFGPLIIAVGWIANRPILALPVVAGVIVLAAGLVYLRRNTAAIGLAA